MPNTNLPEVDCYRTIGLTYYQLLTVLVKKERQHKEQLRAIKNIAFPFWKEQLFGGNLDDFFSVATLIQENINRSQK